MKLLEDSSEGRTLDIGLGNEFLDFTPKATGTKTKVNKKDATLN